MFLFEALRDYLLVVLVTVGAPLDLDHDASDQFKRLSPLEIHIAIEASRRGIDPSVALGVVFQETKFDPMATSHTYDHGLFQIHCGPTFSWCRRFGVTTEQLLEPRVNIPLGLAVLANCRERAERCHGDDCPHWLYYFNHGNWYVRSVLRHAGRYRELLKPFFPVYDKIT